MQTKPPGKIITFYSYKGGTGRSMALANVAWILASNGKRVLTLDWDLEAPGLHRYFHPFMIDKELSSSDGLIDFVLKFAAAAATPETLTTGDTAEKTTVYLAQTDPVLESTRDAVASVLVKSGYTVLPDQPLPLNTHEFETAARDYLKRSTLSVHLMGESSGELEGYPYVYAQNSLAAEREKDPEFSRLVWLPPDVRTVPSQLLASEPPDLESQGAGNVLQAPLAELFNTIRERVKKDKGDRDWYKPYANILRYASSLDWEFRGDNGTHAGSLDVIPAGRQGPSYSTRVNSFNWQNFYDRLGGGVLFEIAKERMRAEYDYILIDSRTGVSDTSGICTVQMPDILVVCFTLNNQSIEGAGAVAQSVHAQRPDLRIFPVPTRVEKFEKTRLERAREAAHARFDHLLDHLGEKNQTEQYWGHVEIFYEPFYAYEEMLATFGDKPNQTNSLLASIERLTGYLTDNAVTQLVAVPESERQIVLAKYERQAKLRDVARAPSTGKEFIFYLSHSPIDDVDYIEKFFTDLISEVRIRLGVGRTEDVGFLDSSAISVGDELSAVRVNALENSRALVALFSPAYFNSEQCGKEFQYFWERTKTADYQSHGLSIFPIVWIPIRATLPGPAKQFQRYEPEGGLRRLMRSTSRSDEYAQFLEDLAEQLIESTRNASPVPRQPITSWREMRNAFAEPDLFSDVASPSDSPLSDPGPRTVNFIYVAARQDEIASIRRNIDGYGEDGHDWQPFFPVSLATVGTLAATTAASQDLRVNILPFDDKITTLVRQAEANNSPVVMIVDAWTSQLAHYREILQSFDRYSFINCDIVLVMDEYDDTKKMQSELMAGLVLTFPYHLRATPNSLARLVRSEADFISTLSHALSQLRSQIINSGRVIRRLDVGEAVAKPDLSVRAK